MGIKVMERVGIYNRCSTEEESQRSALAAQAAESREIADKKGWRITAQYIESETGTVAYKRNEYQRLLSDMEKDKFDIVMIKSIDRLMRSARDWYFFLSRLTENNLRLYIYIEGKFYTPDDNLISGIKAILAEDFSRELSKKIKNAHRRRQEKKSGLNITCEMYGWNKVKKDVYEINEEEAAYYRYAFQMAKEGKGFYTISNRLYDLGARSRNGGKISQVQWRKMLYTKRASGTMILNTRSYNFDTKKYEKLPEKDWIVIENALPPIVTNKYQEEVLKVLSHKSRGKGRSENSVHAFYNTGKYELSHKIICGTCGGYYYRIGKSGKSAKNTVWKCSTCLKNGRARAGENLKGCDNPNVKEIQILKDLQKELEGSREERRWEEALYQELMHMIRKALKAQNSEKELEKLGKEEKRLTAKKDILMEKLLSGIISNQEFQKYNQEFKEKLEAVKNKIAGIKERRQKYNNYECRMKEIENTLEKEKLLRTAIEKVLLRCIDHIVVYGDGSLKILFMEENSVL